MRHTGPSTGPGTLTPTLSRWEREEWGEWGQGDFIRPST